MSTNPTISTDAMNEAISAFMELKIGSIHHRSPADQSVHIVQQLKYHSSWDWLMPVWKKAGKVLFDIRGDLTDDEYLTVHRITKAFIDACQKVYIEGAHLAVYNAIQNIQWYNKQKGGNNEL
jgi:hypothetical protein